MKICFVCSEYPPGPHGGIGTLIQLLARSLVRNGHQVRVIGIYSKDNPAPDEGIDEGVQVFRLRDPRVRKIGWVLARLSLYRRIRAWCTRGEVDVVEVPDYQGMAAFWGCLPVPVITRLSGSATYNALQQRRSIRPLYRWLERRSLKRSDFIISESQFLARATQEVFGLQRDADAVIYNPVEVPKLELKPRRGHSVVFFGTLNHNKGIIPLLESWRLVLERVPDAELHLFGKFGTCGDGTSMKEYLDSRYNGTRIPGVSFYGHTARPQLLASLPNFRAAVFPSKSEGFALAPLEAMAHGCATIFTRSTSGPELINHGENGLLVDPEDPESIAETIIRLLLDDELAFRLSVAGRRRVEASFSLDVVLRQNEDFFRQCLTWTAPR